MTFSEKLVRLRKIKSLTQDEFASAVGVSRQAVYKWESGQSYPEVPKLLEIKLLFGISIDDLLDDTYDIPLPEKKRKKRISREDKERIEAEIRRQEGFDEDFTLDEDIEAGEFDADITDESSDKDGFDVSDSGTNIIEEADKSAPVADLEPSDSDEAASDIAENTPDTEKYEDDTEVISRDTTSDEPEADEAEDTPDVSEDTASASTEEKAAPQKKGFFGRIFGKK